MAADRLVATGPAAAHPIAAEPVKAEPTAVVPTAARPIVVGRLASACVAALLLAATAGWSGQPDSRDEWHLVLIEGKPAGYQRILSRPAQGAGYTTLLTLKLVLKRAATSISIETSTSYDEAEDGKLLGFRCTQKLSKSATESVGIVREGELVILDTVGGKDPRESRIPLHPESVGPRHADDKIRDSLKKPGDAVEVVIFSPEVRRFGRQKAVLGDAESVACQGPPRKLRRVTVTQDFLPGVVTEEWVDDDFQLQKSSVALFGLKMETCRSTVEAVLSQDLSTPPEVFLATSVPVSRAVPRGAAEGVFRITSKGKTFPAADDSYLFRAPGQELVRAEGSAVRVLRVRRVSPKGAVLRPVTPTPELAEYLRPNTFIQSDDKAVSDTAKGIVGEVDDAWKAACVLERWVYENVRTKNLGTAFATAREVAETREGDCTEHAVLLAALLRASGVPSRVTAGLLYHEGAFVGHMWTEAHLGAWVPLDATIGACIVGADHIALAASSLDSATASSFFLEIVPLLGSLSIEVLDVKG